MTSALLCLLAMARTEWQVNANRTLVWNGQPFMPVGLEIQGNADAVGQAKKAGIRDVLLDLPADGTGWDRAFKACDDNGMRYMVTLSTASPVREAVIVDPAGYRMTDIERKTIVDVGIPGATEALLVLAAERDGTIRWSKRVPIVNERLKEEIDPEIELPHVLLIYPIVRSLEAPDFFDGLDAHRDRLLAAFSKNPPGPGYRGLIGPLGADLAFPDADCDAVPTSPLFQTELASYLEKKYTKLPTALRAWGLSANDITTFDQLARLVPLWSETRGVASLWDTVTDHLYTVDRKSSLAWTDTRSTLRAVALRRTMHLIENLKEKSGGPILATFRGWNGPYVSPEIPFSGTSMQVPLDSVPNMLDGAAPAVSTQLRLSNPSVLMATGLAPVANGVSVEDAVVELEGMGVRGWYFRTSDPGQLQTIARLEAAREADPSSSQWKIQGLFYPESARDPAQPMRLVGGLWWLPSPIGGQRIVFGAGIEGYKDDSGPSPVYAMWSTDGEKKVTLKFTDTKTVTVTSVDGQAIPFRRKKNEIDLELSTQAVLIQGASDVPVPTVSMSETVTALTLLFDAFPNQVNVSGSEQYTFAESVKSFDRSPGASFMALRAQFTRLMPKAAPYVWIAASRSPKNNFGEALPVPGSSSETVLLAGTRLAPSEGVLYAEYPLTVRHAGQYEVWFAASIPSEVRDSCRVVVNDKPLGPPAKPVSYYGNGFGWYKFGDVDLERGTNNVRFECPSSRGLDIGLDVVNLAQPGFRPDGPRLPIEWLRTVSPPKGVKPEKGLGG